MRCFVAVDIDNDLKAKIASMQDKLNFPGIKLIEPHNLHFTLKFLGEINEDDVGKVKEILGSLRQHESFDIDLGGIGAFPNADYPRIIWIRADKLLKLQNQVNELLSPLFTKDRDIKPHLTIARIKLLKDKEKIQEFLTNNTNIEIGSIIVKEVFLKKSVLTPTGPVYENLERFELTTN